MTAKKKSPPKPKKPSATEMEIQRLNFALMQAEEKIGCLERDTGRVFHNAELNKNRLGVLEFQFAELRKKLGACA